MKQNEIRCIHRHTIKEHPGCFKKGLVKYNNDREFEKKTGKNWYNFPDYRIGYFDIESDGLKPDFSTMLTWCIKEKDGDYHFDVITKEDLFNEVYDKRIVQSLVNEMRKYKILVGYYSTGMDFPFVRAKALHYDIDFPGYGEIYHFDLYYTVREKLRLSRNSLDNACDYLGIDGKTHFDRDLWRIAKYGNVAALKEVLDHNMADCKITEELHNKLEDFRKWMRKSI